jgi:hypothetical protein
MVCPPATSEAGIMSAKVVSCSNINGYLRNYQDCLTLGWVWVAQPGEEECLHTPGDWDKPLKL